MSDDWDTVTKIGSRAGGGGGGPRQTTVKSKSQLNAAQRSGSILATEKKYSTANAASSSGSGQFLTKVDRSEDIIKPKQGDPAVAKRIIDARNGKKWTQPDLASKSQVRIADLKKYENTLNPAPLTDSDCNKLEKALGIYIRGVLAGQPKVKEFKRNAQAAKK